jgi:hypothetical protein
MTTYLGNAKGNANGANWIISMPDNRPAMTSINTRIALAFNLRKANSPVARAFKKISIFTTEIATAFSLQLPMGTGRFAHSMVMNTLPAK